MEENTRPSFSTAGVDERIDLEVLDESEHRDSGPAIVVSIILHVLVISWIAANYHPVTKGDSAPPMARYVELIRQNPAQDRQFTEAPGAKLQQAPSNAAFSDANREASTPQPTGDKPTSRPGSGGMYAPRTTPGQRQRQPAQEQQPQSQASASAPPQPATQQSSSTLTYRQSTDTSQGTATVQAKTPIDWKSAIREVSKVASLGGGQQGLDLGNAGGEKGFAKDGPISFETSWYDWGDYAQSMVSRIRVNWYEIMPNLIRTGMPGVVTIRFTIHRDGSITDVTILSTSNIPPYDFAAKKAIEASSRLNPLPKDFPNDTERVTAMFYYNLEPPPR
jgi:TonB family protein